MSHINDLKHNVYTTDWNEGLANGTLESFEVLANIAAAAKHVISFLTGAVPVLIHSERLSTDSVSTTYELFEAGVAAGGVAVSLHKHNRVSPSILPTIVSVLSGSTVSVAGTLISTETFLGIKNATGTSEQTRPTRLLLPNTTYYYEVTNNDINIQSYDMHLMFSSSD